MRAYIWLVVNLLCVVKVLPSAPPRISLSSGTSLSRMTFAPFFPGSCHARLIKRVSSNKFGSPFGFPSGVIVQSFVVGKGRTGNVPGPPAGPLAMLWASPSSLRSRSSRFSVQIKIGFSAAARNSPAQSIPCLRALFFLLFICLFRGRLEDAEGCTDLGAVIGFLAFGALRLADAPPSSSP